MLTCRTACFVFLLHVACGRVPAAGLSPGGRRVRCCGPAVCSRQAAGGEVGRGAGVPLAGAPEFETKVLIF